MDDPDSSEPVLPPILDTTYCDSFFDDTTSRIIYHSFLNSCLEYNLSAMLLTFMTVSLKLVIRLPRISTTNQNKRFRSPNPGANLRRRYEDDSTDLIYSTVPSISGKQTHAHISCGVPSISGKQTHAHISCNRTTKITNAYCACFQDRIRTRGAPTRLIDDEFPRWGVSPRWGIPIKRPSTMGNSDQKTVHDGEFQSNEFPRWGVLP
jgi:hypothetical protein